MAAAESVCVDCGVRFDFDPEFYPARGLLAPRRCLECRQRRRSRVILVGVVFAAGSHFSVLQADGEEFFCSGVLSSRLQVGDRCVFEAIEGEVPRPGRRRSAFDPVPA